MATHRALRGSCSCGRNRYLISVPEASANLAEIYFDTSSTSRRRHASPITTFMSVPITWYRSSTTAYYPDETHASIRKTYEAPNPRAVQKSQFCGMCGTVLSCWDEHTPERAARINLTLESMEDEDLEVLEALGLLPHGEEEESDEQDEDINMDGTVQRQGGGEESTVARAGHQRGAPWFEELIEDSRLGRVKRQRGGHTSTDGGSKVDWEVVELEDGTQSTAKRKVEQMSNTT
ncbi:MAG: hypothetical protein M1828_003535 [Chrysothrix sp. TS-e1954]|nr:MAG: hypothetical protein M1828_003535 [Chrysothrix sp. TS-e1954]